MYEEKETDVNIAIAMIKDAAQDVYDTAILVSGDTDLSTFVVLRCRDQRWLGRA